MPGQHLRCLPFRVPVDETMERIDAHHAAGIPDGTELVIRQVPPHIAQRPAVGVGGDHRPMGQTDHICKAPITKVGHIHQHPTLFHPPHRLAAQIRQSLAGTGPCSGSQLILLVPGQHPHPGAGIGIAVHTGRVFSDGGHALHPQKGVEQSLGPGHFGLSRSAHQPDRSALRQFRPGTGEHLPCSPGRIRRIGPGRLLPESLPIGSTGPQGKHQSLHTAPAQPVQMPLLQHPALSPQAAAGHVIEQIGMSVKDHFRCSPLQSFLQYMRLRPFLQVSARKCLELPNFFRISFPFPLDFSPIFL